MIFTLIVGVVAYVAGVLTSVAAKALWAKEVPVVENAVKTEVAKVETVISTEIKKI